MPAWENPRKLQSWKAIAGYFDCDERTAKRWERERGLPVHRAPGGKRSGVFAYHSELDAWLQSGGSEESLYFSALAKEKAPEVRDVPSVTAESQIGSRLASAPISAHPQSGRRLAPGSWPVWISASVAISILAVAAFLIHRYQHSTTLESSRVGALSSALRHVPAPGAEELYLRGRYFWNLRTVDSLSKAIDAYTQAIVKDPSYAEAYAGLAESYDLLPQFANANLAGAFARAENAADRAIELNPKLAAAHRAKAFALFFWDWDIPGSDAEFQRALALDPKSAETHHWYASTLLNRLEGAESVRQIDEALRLSPTSAAIATDAALIHADFGDNLNASMRALQEMEQTQPNLLTPSSFLAGINFAKGDYPAYLAELRRIASITHHPDDIAAADGAVRGWARAGKAGMLEAMISIRRAAFDRGTETGFGLGQTYLMLGRPKEALPYFKASLDEHFILLMTMQNCDWAKKLSNDPSYAALFALIRDRMHGSNTAQPLVTPISFRLPQ
jgi:tetratricopeptide (TPR) repeat protein